MKISQKQAQLLAKEVHRQLMAKGGQKLTEVEKEPLRRFYEKRNKLQAIKDKAQGEVNIHDRKFIAIVGKKRHFYVNHGFNAVVDQMEKTNVPDINDIEDEIILKAMFASEDDLEKFIEKMVYKFSKKLKLKTLVN